MKGILCLILVSSLRKWVYTWRLCLVYELKNQAKQNKTVSPPMGVAHSRRRGAGLLLPEPCLRPTGPAAGAEPGSPTETEGKCRGGPAEPPWLSLSCPPRSAAVTAVLSTSGQTNRQTSSCSPCRLRSPTEATHVFVFPEQRPGFMTDVLFFSRRVFHPP